MARSASSGSGWSSLAAAGFCPVAASASGPASARSAGSSRLSCRTLSICGLSKLGVTQGAVAARLAQFQRELQVRALAAQVNDTAGAQLQHVGQGPANRQFDLLQRDGLVLLVDAYVALEH